MPQRKKKTVEGLGPRRSPEERRFDEGRALKLDSCANCGAEISTRGPRPRSGKRFCSARACTTAKNALNYATRMAQVQALRGEREAPTRCSECERPLAARPWRSGDDLGRWCPALKCRNARDEARLAAMGPDKADLLTKVAHLEVVIQFLSEVVMADSPDHLYANRVTCRKCGLTSALRGWGHPTAEGGGCDGTLEGLSPRRFGIEGLAGAWPFQRDYVEVEK